MIAIREDVSAWTTQIDGNGQYASYVASLIALADRTVTAQPATVLDTGFGEGFSCMTWLTIWPFANVLEVSPEMEPRAKELHDQLCGMEDRRLRFQQGKAENIADYLKGRTLEFVFLDADHAETTTLEQLRAIWSCVAGGGVLTGHDFDGGVKKAVEQFCTENELAFESWHPDGLPAFFWIRKP